MIRRMAVKDKKLACISGFFFACEESDVALLDGGMNSCGHAKGDRCESLIMIVI